VRAFEWSCKAVRFAKVAASEIDAAAAQFPIAEPGRLRSIAAAEFARRVRRKFGLGIGSGGRFSRLVFVVRNHTANFARKSGRMSTFLKPAAAIAGVDIRARLSI